jgi:hypothetical protein
VVGVGDVDGLMRRGVELGGIEALPATDWPGIGRGGYLLDPDGNVFGLISPVLSDGTTGMGGSGDTVSLARARIERPATVRRGSSVERVRTPGTSPGSGPPNP